MREWSNDDLAFLKQMHISPDPSPVDDMRAAIDIIRADTQNVPDRIIIPHRIAKAVVREYGELTIDTWRAYLQRHCNG